MRYKKQHQQLLLSKELLGAATMAQVGVTRQHKRNQCPIPCRTPTTCLTDTEAKTERKQATAPWQFCNSSAYKLPKDYIHMCHSEGYVQLHMLSGHGCTVLTDVETTQ